MRRLQPTNELKWCRSMEQRSQLNKRRSIMLNFALTMVPVLIIAWVVMAQ